ncbi:MAG: hypothetical protein IJS37_01525 [Bacilli bacterium]|nr:hypothetical protein [Bacilli bacterium]
MHVLLSFEFSTDWPILFGAILLLALLALILTTFFVIKRRSNLFRRAFADKSNSVRIFILDTKKDLVTYFNVTSVSNVRHCTMGDFYQMFPLFEQKKIIQWVNTLIDSGSDAPQYLETDMQETRSRRQYFSMLQAEKVDRETGVIHLQSFLMKYMVAPKGSGTSTTHGLSTMADLEAGLRGNGKNRGITIVFRFCYKKITDVDKEINPLVFNYFTNALYPFLVGKRYLVHCSPNELLMMDLRIDDRPKALYFIRSCFVELNRYLSLNGLSSTIDVRAGIVEHRFFAKEMERIIDEARRLATEAYSTKETMIWYEKDRQTRTYLDDSSYRTEVERIINEKKLTYKFRPVLSAPEAEVVGYLTKPEALNNAFASMEDLKDYAVRTDDDRALFTTVAKETVSRFLAQSPDAKKKLFYPVRYLELRYMLVTFARIQKVKQVSMVLMFKENDINEQLPNIDMDAVIDEMRSIKAKGYEIGLFLESAQLQLPTELYAVYDYFICSFAFAGTNREMDARIRSQLHSLVEKLLKYHKPIIASDVMGWPALDLLVKSGLRFVSGDVIAPYDVMMNPVPPHNAKRIKDKKKQ